MRDALLAALFFVLTGLASGYLGLIGLLVLPPFLLPLLWGRPALLPKVAFASALAGLALLPLYALHEAAFIPHGFARGLGETVQYSASLETFLAASPFNRLYGDLTAPFRTSGYRLFPGLVLPALAFSRVLSLVRRREGADRATLALVALAAGAVVVALGPEVRLMGRALGPGPFALVRAFVPFFSWIRVTSRAGIFLALALALLAGQALHAGGGGPRRVALLGALALGETMIAPIPIPAWVQVWDSGKPPPPVYPWLAAQKGEFAIVELPILDNDGRFINPAHHESVYMAYSTLHWKRLVNGYAGVEPALYRRIRQWCRRFPSEESLAALEGVGVKYIVLHRSGYGPNHWARLQRDLPSFGSRLKEVARFSGDTVFELVPRGPLEALSSGRSQGEISPGLTVPARGC